MKRMFAAVPFAVLFALVSTGMSGCGGTYVPGNVPMACYIKDAGGHPVPGLKASLIRRVSNETIQTTFSNSNGYVVFIVIHDEVKTGILESEICKDYKITLVDPNGVYATTEFQPRLASSDTDITVIVPKK